MSWVRIAASLSVVLVTACGVDPMKEAGISCDPMAYQLENEVWLSSNGSRDRLSPEGLMGANSTLSADGRQVVYASGPEEDLDLYMARTDGSGSSLLLGGDGLQSSASWSPDGRHLILDQDAEDGSLQVYRIDQDGSGLVQLTSGAANGKPKWSADGRILFLSLREGEAQEVYSMDPDGSNPVNLTNHLARDLLAEMSPDGSSIVFASDRSGNLEIWSMGPDGSTPRQLTSHPERDTNPTWSSDGRHILFRSDRSPAGLWAMTPDGSDPVLILRDGWLGDCP